MLGDRLHRSAARGRLRARSRDLGFWTGVGVLAGIYALFTLGLQLNVGFTGIINFGQAGFMAIGGYTMAILDRRQRAARSGSRCRSAMLDRDGLRRSWSACRRCACAADYFAIATIASAEMVRLVAQNARGLTGGNQGLFCNDDSDRLLRRHLARRLGHRSRAGSRTSAGRDPDGAGAAACSSSGSTAVLVVTVALRLDPAHALGPRAAGDPRGRGRRPGAGQERASPTSSSRWRSRPRSAPLAGFFLALDLAIVHPDDFEPLFTFYRLRGPGPRRAGELLGRRASASIILWTLLEGTRVRRPADQREPRGGAALRRSSACPDPADGVPAAGLFGKREEMVLGE